MIEYNEIAARAECVKRDGTKPLEFRITRRL